MPRLILALTTATVLALAVPAHAAPAPADYCGGQCSDILPPGTNGSATLAQILAFKAFGIKPPHTDDQLGKYASLVDGYTGLSNQTLGQYYGDASFGVPSGQVASSIHPGGRADVTIVRDKATGTPHVTGTTRPGTEFGAGYAAGQLAEPTDLPAGRPVPRPPLTL